MSDASVFNEIENNDTTNVATAITGGKNWEVENGGTDFKSATTVADSKAYYGNLCNKYDVDYYKYAVPVAGNMPKLNNN